MNDPAPCKALPGSLCRLTRSNVKLWKDPFSAESLADLAPNDLIICLGTQGQSEDVLVLVSSCSSALGYV